MLQKYLEWINYYYPTKESARLQCEQATIAMQEEFPELKRVRGNVLVGLSYRPHWWLVDNKGVIVDPTANQWETKSIGVQRTSRRWREPLGKCINCGELSYKSRGGQSYFANPVFRQAFTMGCRLDHVERHQETLREKTIVVQTRCKVTAFAIYDKGS